MSAAEPYEAVMPASPGDRARTAPDESTAATAGAVEAHERGTERVSPLALTTVAPKRKDSPGNSVSDEGRTVI